MTSIASMSSEAVFNSTTDASHMPNELSRPTEPIWKRRRRACHVSAVNLPGVERAVLEAAKIRDYILSPSHPIGRFKNRFSALGYAQDEWQILAMDLRQHAENGVVTESEKSRFGQKFEVRGKLAGPTGRAAEVTAIWMVRTGEDFPRFVTAYPS